MTDSRLITSPWLPKGSVPKPLSCQGPGNHAADGYRCANTGIGGCLGFVCRFCATKSQPHKAYTEECNVCQLAVKNGCSMSKALAKIAELNPQAVKRGKATCASFDKNAAPCRKCIRKTCAQCVYATTEGKPRTFRTHSNRSPYCGDLCKAAARHESQRQYNDKRREKALYEAA